MGEINKNDAIKTVAKEIIDSFHINYFRVLCRRYDCKNFDFRNGRCLQKEIMINREGKCAGYIQDPTRAKNLENEKVKSDLDAKVGL